MSRRGDVYENSVTGERALILRGDEDGAGLSVFAQLTVTPGGAVAGEHLHPRITERFRVIAGRLGTRVDGVERTLGPGEEATVAPGVRHDWWNAGDGTAEVLVEIAPPDPRFEAMIATIFGLANAGRTNAKGMPGPLQLALIGREFTDVIRFTRPPARVQSVLFGVLGAIGRRRGLRGIYPEYLHPHGRATPEAAVLALAGLAPTSKSGDG